MTATPFARLSCDGQSRWATPLVSCFILLALVAISAYLRYVDLGYNPGWDADEGYNLNVAWNLSEGRLLKYALNNTFVDHPPLFFLILAPAVWLFGQDILVLRALTATYGVLTTGVLFLIGKRLQGNAAGFLAGLFFAIYPLAVAYNRLGYSYNQLMFLTLSCFYLTWPYVTSGSKKHLLAAGLAAGAGVVTDLEGVYLLAFLWLAVAFFHRDDLILAISASAILPVLYVGTMYLVTPADFVADVLNDWRRLSHGLWVNQLVDLAVRYVRLWQLDWWLPLGAVGLFLPRDSKTRALSLLLLGSMLAFILKIRDVNPFFRTGVPLLPLLSLGIGFLLARGFSVLFDLFGLSAEAPATFPSRWQGIAWRTLAVLVSFAILFSPVAMAAAESFLGLKAGFRTGIEFASVAYPDNARDVAAHVNLLTSKEDVIILSPHISWLFKGATADYLQAVAIEGRAALFYPENLPRRRFAYDCSVGNARFVVVDSFAQALAEAVPEVKDVLAEAESWPMEYVSGEYVVYRNPGR